jgi:hypothetical protein
MNVPVLFDKGYTELWENLAPHSNAQCVSGDEFWRIVSDFIGLKGMLLVPVPFLCNPAPWLPYAHGP